VGCYERTLALLIEKYAGAFPLWLADTQAVVIPLAEDFSGYAAEVTEKLKAAGIRVKLDDRNETLKYRIREAQLDKIPYMLVVGEKEKTDGTVAVRARKEEDGGVMKVEDFMAKALMEIATKKR
jgi:threonyl-tRNA synthetase